MGLIGFHMLLSVYFIFKFDKFEKISNTEIKYNILVSK